MKEASISKGNAFNDLNLIINTFKNAISVIIFKSVLYIAYVLLYSCQHRF